MSLNKQRLEAFSDGVYAIVITLLILDIRIPEVDPAILGATLIRLLPQLFAYVLSFFVVGLYWHAHHQVSIQVKQVNSTFIWINLVWLLFVSVLPFPTSLLGRYSLQPIPLTVYGINLILVNVTGFLILFYLKNHPELCVIPISTATLRAQVPIYVVVNGIYVAAIGAAWFFPWLSYGVYILVLIWMMTRYARRANPIEA
jgi:uncharacterized membrane protein